jgi:hypothetical protein
VRHGFIAYVAPLTCGLGSSWPRTGFSPLPASTMLLAPVLPVCQCAPAGPSPQPLHWYSVVHNQVICSAVLYLKWHRTLQGRAGIFLLLFCSPEPWSLVKFATQAAGRYPDLQVCLGVLCEGKCMLASSSHGVQQCQVSPAWLFLLSTPPF